MTREMDGVVNKSFRDQTLKHLLYTLNSRRSRCRKSQSPSLDSDLNYPLHTGNLSRWVLEGLGAVWPS